MWWPEKISVLRRSLRLGVVFVIAGLTAACFQPLYGDHTLTGDSSLKNALQRVDVQQISAPNGSQLSRIAVEVRNDLVFQTGSDDPAPPPTHRLKITLGQTSMSIIVDITTNRPDVTDFGLNATYQLIEIKTGKVVVSDHTFSRVSYDVPGEEQRFAAQRALRDAENRAAQVIADSIRARLASYFVAGT
jgi:LPS-assembly lipoprotein